MKVHRALCLLLAAVCAFAGMAVAPDATGEALERSSLLEALRRGGHVIYFRHTSTDFSQNDAAMTSFEDCARQRNLTETGRAEARAIGAAVQRARIPIGDVLASPYCRTMETARLMFGRAVAMHEVRGGPASADGERYAGLKALLARAVAPGTNVAIASHGNPFYAVAGPPYLAEGEAAVVRATPGGFEVVARVRKDQWDALGR